MSFGLDDLPDQTGRVAVVTGGNAGLGLAVARGLARAGATIVVAARDVDKANEARDRIRSGRRATAPSTDADGAGGPDVDVEALDLTSMASVDACAAAITDRHRQVDLLVNNAGVMGTPERRTGDGFELQFVTNHLGHFALTARLLPALLAAPAARVVSVTSTGRHLGRPVDPANPHLHGNYDPWLAYGQSKLANLHFAIELQRRLTEAGAPVASLVAHPGLVHTGLQAASVEATAGGWSQRFFHGLARTTGMSPAAGALPLLRAATDPQARGGELYAPRYVNVGPPVRRPLVGRSVRRAPARLLWEVSERETGVRFDVGELVRAHLG